MQRIRAGGAPDAPFYLYSRRIHPQLKPKQTSCNKMLRHARPFIHSICRPIPKPDSHNWRLWQRRNIARSLSLVHSDQRAGNANKTPIALCKGTDDKRAVLLRSSAHGKRRRNVRSRDLPKATPKHPRALLDGTRRRRRLFSHPSCSNRLHLGMALLRTLHEGQTNFPISLGNNG